MAKKKTDLTIEERLRAIYKLQLIDSELKQIEILKGELPMEVADLEEEIQNLTDRYEKNQGQLDEINQEIASYTRKIEDAKTLKERYNKQMDNVKNKREHEALEKEIQMQVLDIQLAEKRRGETTTKKEAKEEVINTINEKLESRKSNLGAKKEELEKIIKRTEKEEKSLKQEIEKARKEIPDRLLRTYDKIINRYSNTKLAVATVKRNACGGCFYHIPPQMQLEIDLHKKVVECEHCGRILVDENILKEKKETAAK